MGKKKLLAIMNIHREELAPMLMLMLFSFFIGSSIAFFFTVSISSFLLNFESHYLPYTYLLSGLTGYILWWVYSRIGLRMHFSGLLIFFLSLLLLSVASLCVIYLYVPGKWLSFVLLVWVSAFLFIKGVCFWGMASRIFNISQGKRLFGIISSGEVVSNLIGFFSIPMLLPVVGSSGLLIISVAAIAVCLIIVFLIIRRHSRQLSGKNLDIRRQWVGRKNPVSYKERYYLLVLIFAVFPVFVFYFVDYVFMNLTATQFTDVESLANFMGVFMGVVALVELLLKGFVFSRVVKNYGIRTSLSILAGVLLTSTFMAVVVGSFWGITSVFFSVIALSKLLERAVNNGIQGPSLQILYQPISPDVRTVFQSKIEGLSSASGNIIAGSLIIVFQYLQVTDLVFYNSLLFIVLVLWIALVVPVYKAYKAKLGEALEVKSQKAISNRTYYAREYLLKQSHSGNKFLRSAAKTLLHAADPSWQTEGNTTSPGGPASAPDTPLALRLNALLTKATNKTMAHAHYDQQVFERYSREQEALTQTLSRQEKNESDHIISLLKSESAIMQWAGLKLIGTSPDPALKPYLMDMLKKSPYAEEIKSVLVNCREDIVKDLELVFAKSKKQEVQLAIIEIYSRIGTGACADHLLSKVNDSSRDVWIAALKGLESLNYKVTPFSRTIISEKIAALIRNIVWICSCLGDLDEQRDEQLITSLQNEKKEFYELLYTLLGFIYGRTTIDLIKINYSDSGYLEGVIYALEVMDNFFEDDIKELVFPVFENPSAESILISYAHQFPMQELPRIERWINILYYDYSQITLWTKACALKQAETFGNNDLLWDELVASLFHAHPLIHELAFKGVLKTGDRDVHDIVSRLPSVVLARVSSFPLIAEGRTLFERVLLLTRFKLFANLTPASLTHLAAGCDVVYNEQEHKLDTNDTVCFIIRGRLELYSEYSKIATLEAGEVLIPGMHPAIAYNHVTVTDHCLLLKCPRTLLLSQVWSDIELTKSLVSHIAGITGKNRL